MLMKRYFSIRSKIFLFIFVFMAIPIIVLTYLSNQVSQKSLLEQTKINDLQTIDCLQESTDTLLDSFESLGTLISSDRSVIQFLENSYDLQNNFPECFENLNFQDIVQPYLDCSDALLGISAVNKNYIFVGEQTYDKDQLSWYFNKTSFEGLAAAPFHWTAPHMLLDTGTQEILWAISYVTPVYKGEDILGYLILYMDRSRLDRITQTLSDTVYIINDSEASASAQQAYHDCYIISDKTSSRDTFNLYTASFYYKSKINYNYLVNNSSIITSANGSKLTITSQKYSRMGWIYLIVSPYTEISQRILSQLSRLFVICAASIVFALISAYMISSTITRPVFALNKTIRKVTDGNLEIRHNSITNDEIGILALAFNSLLDRIQELMKNISDQQKNKRKLQLQLIQAQVKPHFLYNVLEMISSLIRDHLDTYALDSISHLANFYRTSLSDGSDIISVKKEVEMTENYLALQHMRYIEFMDFYLDISEEIFPYQIPKLTLQPLVENAIYHGLKTTCEKGILKVSGYLKNNRIFFEVYDDGAGMDESTVASVISSLDQENLSKDFGISSVVKRLNIHFNNQTTLDIHSETGEYTNIILSFPALKL